jgi:hypothetical protein
LNKQIEVRNKETEKTTWKKGESPHCEIHHIEFDGKRIIFHLTKRGEKEHQRQDKNEHARQLYREKHPPMYYLNI